MTMTISTEMTSIRSSSMNSALNETESRNPTTLQTSEQRQRLKVEIALLCAGIFGILATCMGLAAAYSLSSGYDCIPRWERCKAAGSQTCDFQLEKCQDWYSGGVNTAIAGSCFTAVMIGGLVYACAQACKNKNPATTKV